MVARGAIGNPWLFRQMQAGGTKAMSFGKSKARLLNPDEKKVTFADVAGVNEAKEELEEIIDFLHLESVRKIPVGRLPYGVQKRVELGRALAMEPTLLLLDEPVAGMTQQEMERTAELLTSLAGERSVVVVEHDMEFVRSIAQKVTVLHQGSVLAEGRMDEVQNNPDVIEVYLGEDQCSTLNN